MTAMLRSTNTILYESMKNCTGTKMKPNSATNEIVYPILRLYTHTYTSCM